VNQPVLATRDGHTISDDAERLDIDLVHGFLSRDAYWSAGVPRHVIERAIANSLCFGVFDPGMAQVGFARVVTDRASFAYLCDVFIIVEARGRGLGRWLCATVLTHPDLQGLRRFLLATADAHGLYSPLGFAPLSKPDRFLERYVPAARLYAQGE